MFKLLQKDNGGSVSSRTIQTTRRAAQRQQYSLPVQLRFQIRQAILGCVLEILRNT